MLISANTLAQIHLHVPSKLLCERDWGIFSQENDVEREVNIHRDKKDYTQAEAWKWIISGKDQLY